MAIRIARAVQNSQVVGPEELNDVRVRDAHSQLVRANPRHNRYEFTVGELNARLLRSHIPDKELDNPNDLIAYLEQEASVEAMREFLSVLIEAPNDPAMEPGTQDGQPIGRNDNGTS